MALLKEGWTSLHLDARRAGVLVPPHLKNEAHLVLQYGNDLPIPIPDLTIDEAGVTATLSFARSPHQTVVPWSAVYVVASDDGRGVLYHEDIPRDVSVIASPNAAETLQNQHGPKAAGPPKRALRAVPLDADQTDGQADERPASGGQVADGAEGVDSGLPAGAAALQGAVEGAPRRRKRPQLRLVK